MPKHLLLIGACAGALLGASFVGVRADETPTSSTTATKSQSKPLSGVTSLSVDPTSSKGDVQAFLNTPVSFVAKDVSFLGALDAVLGASGKTCLIECRRVKPMKLSFGAKAEKTGDILDSLAKAGGCTLFVLPDKLLLSPPELLSGAERDQARAYNVLLAPGTAKVDAHLLDVANTKVTVSLNGLRVDKAIAELSGSVGKPFSCEYHMPLNRAGKGYIDTGINLSFDNVAFGDALSTVAHLYGCQVYLLPDKFLICAPGTLSQVGISGAVPIFQPNVPGVVGPSTPAS